MGSFGAALVAWIITFGIAARLATHRDRLAKQGGSPLADAPIEEVLPWIRRRAAEDLRLVRRHRRWAVASVAIGAVAAWLTVLPDMYVDASMITPVRITGYYMEYDEYDAPVGWVAEFEVLEDSTHDEVSTLGGEDGGVEDESTHPPVGTVVEGLRQPWPIGTGTVDMVNIPEDPNFDQPISTSQAIEKTASVWALWSAAILPMFWLARRVLPPTRVLEAIAQASEFTNITVEYRSTEDDPRPPWYLALIHGDHWAWQCAPAHPLVAEAFAYQSFFLGTLPLPKEKSADLCAVVGRDQDDGDKTAVAVFDGRLEYARRFVPAAPLLEAVRRAGHEVKHREFDPGEVPPLPKRRGKGLRYMRWTVNFLSLYAVTAYGVGPVIGFLLAGGSFTMSTATSWGEDWDLLVPDRVYPAFPDLF